MFGKVAREQVFLLVFVLRFWLAVGQNIRVFEFFGICNSQLKCSQYIGYF
jgi:hypothetical protein